jgi:uncharacterized protein (DUF952 family)/uncharacterized protein (DUF1330 family)
MLIYKILQAAEWQDILQKGATAGAPIDVADGFVHFSTADQVRETAARHFATDDDLILAALDADALGDSLKWEVSRGGALFPHLYAPLRLADITWHAPLRRGPDAHIFPERMAAPAQPDAHVDPTRAQFDAFKAQNRDAPVEMLNLLRLRDTAAYPRDHPLAGAGLTGAEAYARYGAETASILDRLGGSIVWRGRFETTLIGPADESWDHVFIARYPSAHAFLAMIKDADYAAAVLHRQAAVATSRLIRCGPAEAGAFFG